MRDKAGWVNQQEVESAVTFANITQKTGSTNKQSLNRAFITVITTDVAKATGRFWREVSSAINKRKRLSKNTHSRKEPNRGAVTCHIKQILMLILPHRKTACFYFGKKKEIRFSAGFSENHWVVTETGGKLVSKTLWVKCKSTRDSNEICQIYGRYLNTSLFFHRSVFTGGICN